MAEVLNEWGVEALQTAINFKQEFCDNEIPFRGE
jgi:hypothetical protein